MPVSETLRFCGFSIDAQRAYLRSPTGEEIRLRPQSFAMLLLFLANPGRVLSKQELFDAIWPNVHVGDDSLFQCIREIRAALADDQRQLIKLVSGRGYLLQAEVQVEPAHAGAPEKEPVAPAHDVEPAPPAGRVTPAAAQQPSAALQPRPSWAKALAQGGDGARASLSAPLPSPSPWRPWRSSGPTGSPRRARRSSP
jgi:DNA-binding winged helix-turn-helix (wHTH) protein